MKTNPPASPPAGGSGQKKESLQSHYLVDKPIDIPIEQITESQIQDLRDFDEVRILKDRGFYGVTLPVTRTVPGIQAQTADNFNGAFFIANRDYRVIEIRERHEKSAAAPLYFANNTAAFTIGDHITGGTSGTTAIILQVPGSIVATPYISMTLNFSMASGPFTVGDLLSGNVTHASGTIVSWTSDGGTGGTVTLNTISGFFQATEGITTSHGDTAILADWMGIIGEMAICAIDGTFTIGESFVDEHTGVGVIASPLPAKVGVRVQTLFPGDTPNTSTSQDILFDCTGAALAIDLTRPGNTVQKFTLKSSIVPGELFINSTQNLLTEGDALWLAADGSFYNLTSVSVSVLLKAV